MRSRNSAPSEHSSQPGESPRTRRRRPTRELFISTGRIHLLQAWSIHSGEFYSETPASEGCDVIRVGDSVVVQSELNTAQSHVVFWHIEDTTTSTDDDDIPITPPSPLRKLGQLGVHQDDINRLCHIPSSDSSGSGMIASASKDQTVGLWSMDEWKEIGFLRGHTGHVYGVCCSTVHPESNIVSCGWDRRLRVWDVGVAREKESCGLGVDGFSGELVECVSAGDGPGNNCIFVCGACGDNTVRMIDLRQLRPGSGSAVSGEVSVDGVTVLQMRNIDGVYSCGRIRNESRPLVLAGDHWGHVSLWDLRNTSSFVSKVRRHSESVWCFQQLPRVPRGMFDDGHTFAFVSSGYDKDVNIWSLSKEDYGDDDEGVPPTHEPMKNFRILSQRLRQGLPEIVPSSLSFPARGNTYGLCYIGFDEWEWGEFSVMDEAERFMFLLRGLQDPECCLQRGLCQICLNREVSSGGSKSRVLGVVIVGTVPLLALC